MAESKANFRYDINALRAIAVIGVVLFHFNIPFFKGGFSGVDIFFVISGYLMTRIIIAGLAKDKFSISDFYNRRIQRIVPGLMAMIALVVAITFLLFLPPDFEEVAKNANASMLFYSNILYHFDDYFGPASENNIFLHTWSLSVEWQFYLILPILLIFLNKFLKNDRRKFLILFISATLLFFLGSLVVTKFYPKISFYFLPTRCWEMLIGGVAFLAEGTIKPFGKKYFYAGYAILGLGMILLKETMLWPGLYTLVPVLATFFIILANQNSWFVLRLPVVQFFGRISYSLYLWHWPVFVIGSYLGLTSFIGNRLALMLLSVLLGYLSYRYIESFRFNKKLTPIYISIAIAGLSAWLWIGTGNQIIFKNETVAIANYIKVHREERHKESQSTGCFLSPSNKTYNEIECLKIDKTRPNVLLIGDSHSAHFSTPLREALAKQGINMNQASATGCMPILRKNGKSACSVLIDHVYSNYIRQNSKYIKGVIISANWINARQDSDLVKDIENTIAYLEKLNIKVILLGQNETYTIPFPSIAARTFEYGYRNFEERFLEKHSFRVNKMLLEKLPRYYVDIYNLRSVPKLSKDNVPYMADKTHYTISGSIMVTNLIVNDPKFKKFLEPEIKSLVATN
ncbi:acyltransferase family protein [Dyadobacter aurulentus]|uniref:acyltransferase family protein n=1 Tax=Dyadobacter sp. UC 10 TaxID=2605428 RepID=UPI0011F13992|nr:acyltransferase family protein [Dyadobacter sp. UC 10]KAA0991865.1 acyltransferase [Dyadobacter sp. UC 10]